MRALVVGAALLLFTGQMPAPPSAATYIATLAGHNAALKHYTFDVETRVAMLSFPWIRFTMHGKGEYTRGGPYYVHFDSVPWYARGFDTIEMDAIDIANWPRLYNMAIVGQDGDSVTMVLHDAKGSNLKEARAKLDPTGVREVIYTYDYGGHIATRIESQLVGTHYLPASETAEITMPRYRATATASFTNYKVEMDPDSKP